MKPRRDDLIPFEVVQKEDLKALGNIFATRIKFLCKSNKITVKDLEKKSKVKLDQVLKSKRFITINEAKSLAKVLKVTPEYVIAGD